MERPAILAEVLFLVICVLPGWSQSQSDAERCDLASPRVDDAPRTRTQVTWVNNADGKLTAVRSPVREMKVARLIFVGRPALPLLLQEQIAKKVDQIDYDDNQTGVEELLARIRDAWQEQGYFKVTVAHSGSQTLEESPERRTVAITVHVDAGKQYRLGELHFSDASSSNASRSNPSPGPPQQLQFTPEQLRSFFLIERGDVFDTHKLQKGLEELRKAYGVKGFINFVVVPTFNIDETSDRITLAVEIEEGKQFHIGNIKAPGLDPAISKQLFESSGLAPGNVFNTSRLEAFFRKNQATLPDGFRAEDDVERRTNEVNGTVDLILHLSPCPAP